MYRHYNVVGPMFLLVVGTVLLLSTTGWLPVSAWDVLWRLWPLLLVAWGLQALFGRRSAVGALLTVIITLGLGAAVVYYSVATGAIAGSTQGTTAISQPLGDASEADVTFRTGVGTMILGDLSDSPNLIQGTVANLGGLTLNESAQLEGDTMVYDLSTSGFTFAPPGPTWNLDLNSRVPLRLRVDHGVGSLALDLTRLELVEASVHLGVGDAQITAPDSGRSTLDVDHSIGTLQVVIPAGMDARIRIDTGLGNAHIDPRFRQVGEDTYETEGYVGADERVDVTIDHSIGEVTVR